MSLPSESTPDPLSLCASPENQEALAEIQALVELAQGEFSLVLARCNYARLRDCLIEQLQQEIPNLRLIHLEPTTQQVYATLRDSLTETLHDRHSLDQPTAVLITGLEQLTDREAAVKGMNQVREEFRKTFSLPLIFWVTDDVLKQFIRIAPDFESWVSTVEFTLPTPVLIQSLTDGAEALFAAALAENAATFAENLAAVAQLGILRRDEVDAALHELDRRGVSLSSREQASVDLIRGWDAAPEHKLQFLAASWAYWQTVPDRARQGLLLYALGEFTYRSLEDKDESLEPVAIDWGEAKRLILQSRDRFSEADRPDLVAKCLPRLQRILQRQGDWAGLADLTTQEALPLHQRYGMVRAIAGDHGFLAEVALQEQQWAVAKEQATQALALLEQVEPSLQWLRSLFLCYLAEAERGLGDAARAIALLQEARKPGDLGHPLVYFRILDRLREGYWAQGQYEAAFDLKQERQVVEAFYGYRAFVGPVQLRARYTESMQRLGQWQGSLAPEIVASGRGEDVRELVKRVGSTRYKLIVLHGPSGVGKSSLVNAGLIPALRQTLFGEYEVVPVAIRRYTDWVNELAAALFPHPPAPSPQGEGEQDVQSPSPALGEGFRVRATGELPPQPPAPSPTGGEGGPDNQSPSPIVSEGRSDNQSPSPVLGEGFRVRAAIKQHLITNEQNYIQTVLIFDQFEEFFFANPQPLQRRQFFEFLGDLLNDAANLTHLNVILSLREDYLHYLLECNRLESMKAISQDILSREVLYAITNLSVERTRTVIQSLTANTRFPMPADLIEALVQDLKDEVDEIRPIELQVVGTQLQTERIRTLDQYRQYGQAPKRLLVQHYLEAVVRDCGPENEQLASLVLYLLTDERGTRPLRTWDDLVADLRALADELSHELRRLQLVLRILVKSGLVVALPAAPADQYQLVHDYIAAFIRATQAPKLKELMAQLEQERERNRQLQAQYQVTEAELGAAQRDLVTTQQRTRVWSGVGVAM
ncbi:nSTAND1 domain-containing NTPase, partial [Trichothermofontia sp.]